MAWIAIILLMQAAMLVHGDAHSSGDPACDGVLKDMEANPPKSSSGEVCFPDRRLGAIPDLPEQPHGASPFGRRLAGHLAMFKPIKVICEDSCKAKLDDFIAKCEKVLPAQIESLKPIMSMCTDCGKVTLDMMLDECDFGDGSVKVCDAKDKCMNYACGMASSCSTSGNPMGMLMVSDEDWEKGVNAHNKALESCPCPVSSTSAATKWTTASSFSVVALLAFLVHSQQ